MLSSNLLERHEGYVCKRVTNPDEVIRLVRGFLDREDLELAVTTDWIGTDEDGKVPYYLIHIRGYGIELERLKEATQSTHQ